MSNHPHNGSRPQINWDAARAWWLAQPPERRTHQAVADRFKVSRSRVSQIAARDRWDDRLVEVLREADKRVIAQAVRSQAELATVQRRIAARLQDRVLEQLEGADELELNDGLRRLPGILRLDQLLAGEATDRVDLAEVKTALVSISQVAIIAGRESWPPERTLEALREATAGLVALPAAAP